MWTRVRPRLTYANVIASVALFIALGGGSYAALQVPRASVGTKQLKRNAVTSPKVNDGSLLLSDFNASQLSQLRGPAGVHGTEGPRGATGPEGLQGPRGATGPEGLQGPRGATGPEGPPAPRIWAEVREAQGGFTITVQTGGIGFSHPSPGVFLLNMNRNLDNIGACAAVAMAVGNENLDLRVSTTFYDPAGTTNDTIVVKIWEVTPLNQLADADFNLQVLC